VEAEVDKWMAEVVSQMEDISESGGFGGCEWGGGEDSAWDDVNGGSLPVDLVRAARMEEIGFMKSKPIWEECSVEDCWIRTGRGPVSVRWVDTNKGS
jgi:hypothetical protein